MEEELKCQRCGSDRLLTVSAKTSDRCSLQYKEHDRTGYIPTGLEIGDDDYLEFDMCLDCGQHQGAFPIPEERAVTALAG